jgi:nicotinate-nucleotide adenylyltransferase
VVVTTGLYGGAFDPPHLGHVELARVAKLTLDIEALLVLVSEAPGHKDVHASTDDRLALARAAFPDDEVRLDPYPRTVDFLRAEEFDEPLFVIGADEFQDFLTWKEPDEVVALARLAVATRPGYPREGLDGVLSGLAQPERVGFFEIEPNRAASRDIRALAAAGEPLDGLVPPDVAELIRTRRLYIR